MDCSTSIINSQSLLKLMSLSRWCHPTISSSVIPFSFGLQFFPASGSSNESVIRIRWPKYWSFSFSFSISPSNEYSGPISFRMDWLDLLAVQETFKSLFQHHGWNKFHEKILVLLLCVCSNLAVLFFFPFFKSGIFNLLNWFHHLLTGYHLQFVKALSQEFLWQVTARMSSTGLNNVETCLTEQKSQRQDGLQSCLSSVARSDLSLSLIWLLQCRLQS